MKEKNRIVKFLLRFSYNPFRTKKILVANPKGLLWIEVPFFGKCRFKYEAYKILSGQTADMTIIDEVKVI